MIPRSIAALLYGAACMSVHVENIMFENYISEGIVAPLWMHANSTESRADTALCISGEFRVRQFNDIGTTSAEEIARFFNLIDGKTDVFLFVTWAKTSKTNRNYEPTPKTPQSKTQKQCMNQLSPWTKMWAAYHWPGLSEPGVATDGTRACGDWNGTEVGTDARCVTNYPGLPQYWSMKQCYSMVEKFEEISGHRYKWLIRSRADSDYTEAWRTKPQHPMHPRHEWKTRIPAGSVLVNALHLNSPETCLVEANTGDIYKSYHCTGLPGGDGDFAPCIRWWKNDTLSMDDQLPLRDVFALPGGLRLPFASP